MNEKDVTYFSTLLNVEAKDVEQSVEDGTLGEKLNALGLSTKEQVETLKTNLSKEVRTQHISELTESAKKGELDPDLYKVIKGASYEQLERQLAKEYNVTDFDGVTDLVAKISKNSSQKLDDKKLNELNEKIENLQKANERLLKEKDEAVTTAKAEKDSWILNREKSDIVRTVPFDLTDVDEKDLERITGNRQKILTDVFDARYSLKFKDDGKIVIMDKEGKERLNPATYEPIPASDVFKELALELGLKLKSPESGGQGGKSSGGKTAQFKTYDEFKAYCEENKISPTSQQGIKIWAERRIKS